MHHYPTPFLRHFNGLESALDRLPVDLAGDVLRWVIWATPQGGFINAVLLNDLYSAAGRAGEKNACDLQLWGSLLNYLPLGSWGSAQAIQAWRGLVFDAEQGSASSPAFVSMSASSDEVRYWRLSQEISFEEVKP